jgi:hypothetical protein
MCSGEVDDLVSKIPPEPSIKQSNKNDSHLANKGNALLFRNS